MPLTFSLQDMCIFELCKVIAANTAKELSKERETNLNQGKRQISHIGSLFLTKADMTVSNEMTGYSDPQCIC